MEDFKELKEDIKEIKEAVNKISKLLFGNGDVGVLERQRYHTKQLERLEKKNGELANEIKKINNEKLVLKGILMGITAFASIIGGMMWVKIGKIFSMLQGVIK